MAVIRRDKKSSIQDLILALERFSNLLVDQKENEAADALSSCVKELSSQDGVDCRAVAKKIMAIFEEHELGVYMQSKLNYSSWTDSDDLLEACSRVHTLVKRLL